ncbi:MAG: site-2 protease family protein [Candidatus Eiseniibacteriota bacterium]|jgi:Zn-dependent protease
MFLSPDILLVVVPVFLLAICLHEAAHAFVADRLGDPTARELGRLTLNPLRHLDVIGTIVFFVAGFGWAKPVPVDPRRLRDPLRDGVWIAAAGPGANVVLALASAILLRVVVASGGAGAGTVTAGVASFLNLSVTVNLVLALFNLIPLPPLDGSKVLLGLLPRDAAARFARVTAAGPAILFGLIILGNVSGHSFFGAVLWPAVDFVRGVLMFGMG